MVQVQHGYLREQRVACVVVAHEFLAARMRFLERLVRERHAQTIAFPADAILSHLGFIAQNLVDRGIEVRGNAR